MARAGRAFVVCGLAILVGPLGRMRTSGDARRTSAVHHRAATRRRGRVADRHPRGERAGRRARRARRARPRSRAIRSGCIRSVAQPGDALPFGAVAQTSTAGASDPARRAGHVHVRGDRPGGAGRAARDACALLADTRVGDIRRVGLASARVSDWILGDLEVRVNGTLLLADRAGPSSPDAAQQALTARIAAIDGELDALRTRYEALAAPRVRMRPRPRPSRRRRAVAGRTDGEGGAGADRSRARRAATRAADLARRSALRTIDASSKSGETRAADEADRRRPSRRHASVVRRGLVLIRGGIPAGLVQTASVTLETCAHAGADTLHPVYVRVGGHKYA